MKIVTVVGLGNVGSTVVSLLIEHLDQAIINVIDVDPNIEGSYLDLVHGSIAKNDIHLRYQDESLLPESDIIIYCAGIQNKHNESRNSVAIPNIKTALFFFQKFKPKKGVKIFIVSNPVDIICSKLKSLFKEDTEVYSTGTLIDTLRYRYLLSEATKTHHKLVESLVIGEHGNSMAPINSHTYIDNRPVVELLSEQELDDIRNELINCASYIRRTADSTKYAIAQSMLIILHALKNKQVSILPISIPIPESYKTLLGISEDIFISLPCEVSEGNISPVDRFELQPKELEMLKKSAMKMESIVQDFNKHCITSKTILKND